MNLDKYDSFPALNIQAIKYFYNEKLIEGKEFDDALLETAQKFQQSKAAIEKIILEHIQDSYTKKFEEYINNIPHISREDIGLIEDDDDEKISNGDKEIVRYSEFRKGSDKWGSMVLKLMEWLRLKKEEMKKDLNNIQIETEDFENETNIKLSELEAFVKDKIAKGLYTFDIIIDYNNNLIKFYNLSDKNTLQIEKTDI
jgi:hypothetical protein